MAYKLPKAFKPAVLDRDTVDSATLGSSKTQLWHFTFPLDFNVAGFSELELHLPAEPISNSAQVPQMVASFELDGASYRIIEGSVFEAADLVNLFPAASSSSADASLLQPGKPFTRSFRICRDILFPAPANRPIPINPLGRAPRQLQDMRKNFLPVGFMHESFGKKELEGGDKQGRVLRSGSARPSSPRLLPKHGFDLGEWRPKTKAAAGGGASAGSSAAEEAARKAAKKEKKEAKRRAEALAATPSAAAAAESSNKKQRTSSSTEGDATKKKKKDKH